MHVRRWGPGWCSDLSSGGGGHKTSRSSTILAVILYQNREQCRALFFLDRPEESTAGTWDALKLWREGCVQDLSNFCFLFPFHCITVVPWKQSYQGGQCGALCDRYIKRKDTSHNIMIHQLWRMAQTTMAQTKWRPSLPDSEWRSCEGGAPCGFFFFSVLVWLLKIRGYKNIE